MLNKPVVVLALTAIALAGAGVYLLQRIDAERTAAAAAGPEPMGPPPAVARAPAPTAAPGQPPSSTASAATPAQPQPAAADVRAPVRLTPEEQKARQRRRAAEFLAQYDNPAERVHLRQGALDSARRSTAELAERLNLTTEKQEELVQLLADLAMERRAAVARCVVDPSCVSPEMNGGAFTAFDQQLRDLIGDEGVSELRTFGRTERDRRAVSALQARLPDGQALTQSQTDALTAALYEEGARQRRAMYESQQHQDVYDLSDGPSLMYADQAPTLELMLQSGEAYVQLMRDRAATHLTGDQLVAFNEMYDDLLISFRQTLRRKYGNTTANDRTP